MDPDQELQVDIVPPAEVEVVELEDFLPLRCIVPVLRADGESCACGLWQFYSAVCGHLYQTFDARCGATKNKKNTRTLFCPKTASRALISNIQVNAPCSYPVCQNEAEEAEDVE
jgi:hypothetical protein